VVRASFGESAIPAKEERITVEDSRGRKERTLKGEPEAKIGKRQRSFPRGEEKCMDSEIQEKDPLKGGERRAAVSNPRTLLKRPLEEKNNMGHTAIGDWDKRGETITSSLAKRGNPPLPTRTPRRRKRKKTCNSFGTASEKGQMVHPEMVRKGERATRNLLTKTKIVRPRRALSSIEREGKPPARTAKSKLCASLKGEERTRGEMTANSRNGDRKEKNERRSLREGSAGPFSPSKGVEEKRTHL